MSIVDLSGKEVKSAKSEEESRQEALKAFQEQIDKLDEDRYPINKDNPTEDIFHRVNCIKTAIESVYKQVQVGTKGTKDGPVPVINGVLDLPLLAPTQIAVLSDRLFKLVSKL